MKVAEGVYRLGTKWANWYLVEDQGGLTVLDTGFAGYWQQLPDLLGEINKSFDDIKAVVLSHHHTDHTGNANKIREQIDCDVFIHETDLPYIVGDRKAKIPNFIPLMRYPTILAYLAHAGKNGGMKTPKIQPASPFSDGDSLAVPGNLKVIHTPGHTMGNCSFYSESKNVLFSTDALLTINPRTFAGSPSIQPRQLNENHDEAIGSLARLENYEAPLMLPGHGEPWTAGVKEAVRLATEGSRKSR